MVCLWRSRILNIPARLNKMSAKEAKEHHDVVCHRGCGANSLQDPSSDPPSYEVAMSVGGKVDHALNSRNKNIMPELTKGISEAQDVSHDLPNVTPQYSSSSSSFPTAFPSSCSKSALLVTVPQKSEDSNLKSDTQSESMPHTMAKNEIEFTCHNGTGMRSSGLDPASGLDPEKGCAKDSPNDQNSPIVCNSSKPSRFRLESVGNEQPLTPRTKSSVWLEAISLDNSNKVTSVKSTPNSKNASSMTLSTPDSQSLSSIPQNGTSIQDIQPSSVRKLLLPKVHGKSVTIDPRFLRQSMDQGVGPIPLDIQTMASYVYPRVPLWRQTTKEEPPRPKDYTVLSCMVTVCCNPPMGILALALAVRSETLYQKADYKGSKRFSRLALTTSVIAILVTVLLTTSLLVVFWPEHHKPY